MRNQIYLAIGAHTPKATRGSAALLPCGNPIATVTATSDGVTRKYPGLKLSVCMVLLAVQMYGCNQDNEPDYQVKATVMESNESDDKREKQR